MSERDAIAAGVSDDGIGLNDGGTGATAYAEAVGVYLAFALSKQTDLGNSLCRWEPIAQCPRQLFGRQAIPMVWDYAEGNPLGNNSGSWTVFVDGIVKAFSKALSLFKRAHQDGVDKRMQGHRAFLLAKWLLPTLPTTTTLDTLTFPTSSTSGCAVLSVQSFPNSSPRWPSPRPRN